MNLKFYILIFVSSICLISCESETTGISVMLGDGNTIRVPLGYTHITFLSDSYAGEIYTPDKEVYIMYDIGDQAGNYVDPDNPNKIVDHSVNSIFWYEEVDSQYLADPNCCIYFTFPDCGPANFVSRNDKSFNQVLDIIKSFKSK